MIQIFKFEENYTKRLQTLLLILLISSITLVLHSIGINNFFYWSYWWFDILTHCLGGITLGLSLAYFISKKYIWFLLLSAGIIIVGWELFEVYIVGVDVNYQQYLYDTVVDIIVGFASAYLSAFAYYRNG